MTDSPLFNIAPASLTLGEVLAYGNGTTLYKADLLQGQQSIQVCACLMSSLVSSGSAYDTPHLAGQHLMVGK